MTTAKTTTPTTQSGDEPAQQSFDEVLLVLTTVDSNEHADRIARLLVDEQLAACVTRLAGCRSVYRWQGAVEGADEILLLIKSTRLRYPALEQRLQAIHPYELPEIVAIAPHAVLPAYAAWVREAVRTGPG